MLNHLEWDEPHADIESSWKGELNRHAAVGVLNGRIKDEGSGAAEWLKMDGI